MLVREANAMFWIGRYVERAEATARIVDVQYHSELEGGFPLVPSQDSEDALPSLWGPILAISGDAERFAEKHGEDQAERNVLDFFAFDRTAPNSITSCVIRARENARGVREMLSSEMYESLNMFFLEVTRWDVDKILDYSPHDFFTLVKNASHLFHGIADRTMPNSEERAFLECGMFLERADKTARLLDVQYHRLLRSQVDPGGLIERHEWGAVLRSVSAFEAFHRSHRFIGVTPASVAGFLVLNPAFPSSICFCVRKAEKALREVGASRGQPPANRAERLIGRLHSDLAFLTPEEILETGLHDFLDQVQIRCNEIGEAISEAYLRL